MNSIVKSSLGVLSGLVVANAIEWVAHKYILHGIKRTAKPRISLLPASMAYHWQHHKSVRKQGYLDDMYLTPYRQGNAQVNSEINQLLLLCVLFTPTWRISPAFTLTGYYCAYNYFRTHKRSHLEPAWGKAKIPWHYDHHMNTNQDANWCVTKPWFDYILGTRIISSPDTMEANPLGVSLPRIIEKPLNALAKKLRPSIYRKLMD